MGLAQTRTLPYVQLITYLTLLKIISWITYQRMTRNLQLD